MQIWKNRWIVIPATVHYGQCDTELAVENVEHPCYADQFLVEGVPQELGLSDYVVPKMKDATLVKFDTIKHLKIKFNITIDANIDFIRIQYLQFINSPPGIYVICFLLVQLSSYMRESEKYLKSVRAFHHISIYF